MVMMSRDYIYVQVCWRDWVGQIGKSGSLRKEGRREVHDYSEIPRW
jgi:hypothetical protein